jgi:hypothetical protein
MDHNSGYSRHDGGKGGFLVEIVPQVLQSTLKATIVSVAIEA